MFAVGWVAALAFQSPEQRAAEAQAPEALPIFERVVVGDLVDEVTTRAQVVPEFVDPLNLRDLPENPVITSVPARAGSQIKAGNVVVVVNGRPVFVMPGAFPFYRDLRPGMSGPDVTQLQDGLRAAGRSIPEREGGTYGTRTQRAVTEMYKAAGFEQAILTEGGEGTETSPPPAGSPPTPPAKVPYLPLTEVVVAPRLPATVAQVPAVGDLAGAGDTEESSDTASLIVLRSGALQARAEVPASVVVRVRSGMSVEMSVDSATAAGKVAAVREVSGSTEGEGSYELILTPERPLPAEWSDRELLARIIVEVASEPGLIVPSRAVSTNAQGVSSVTKRDGDSLVRVQVHELGSLTGRSVVAATEEGALEEGDHVRVG